MTRLGRKAARLAAFYPLTSTPTAYADCAWLLWEALAPAQPSRPWWRVVLTSWRPQLSSRSRGLRGSESQLVTMRRPEEDHPRGQKRHDNYDSAGPDHAL